MKTTTLKCKCGKPQFSGHMCQSCYSKDWRIRHPKAYNKYNSTRRAKVKAGLAPNEYIAAKIEYPPRPCMECREQFNPAGPFNRRCSACNKHFEQVGGKEVRSRFGEVVR